VLVTRRPKLACRACPGVVLQAAAPERLVPGGLPTEATVAQVLVARYADHLPLYRQAQMLARQGLTLGREVLADWLGTAAQEIRPVCGVSARSCSPRPGCSPTRPPCRCATQGGAVWPDHQRQQMPGSVPARERWPEPKAGRDRHWQS
jgi:hypothetical protein